MIHNNVRYYKLRYDVLINITMYLSSQIKIIKRVRSMLIKAVKVAMFSKTKKQQTKILADYTLRGQFRYPLNMKKGDLIHDFEVKEIKKFNDFNIEYIALQCKNSGAFWHHFDCQQQNNTFSLIFDCAESPHMVKLALEKMLLCGSKKFPIRDPFKQMKLRSFTPEDFTFVSDNYMFFGFQTSLTQDHKNLLGVTLQTVLNPLMRRQDFDDVIWRYSIDQNRGVLEINGQLAKQLEGQWFGTNHTNIYHSIQKNLLQKPGLNKKQDLLHLKYEDLVDWHPKIVNQSKMTIITHGDMPVSSLIGNYRNQIQKRAEKWFLVNASQKDQIKQTEKEEFKSKTIVFDQLETAIPVILSFRLDDVKDEERIQLQILSYLLYDLPDSPMMKWNTPETPYPKLYGYQQTHFNISVTVPLKEPQSDHSPKKKNPTEKQLLQEEQAVIKQLSKITKDKFPDQLIEQCLLHLEGQYYERDGMNIITKGCLGTNEIRVDDVLNVKSVINGIMRRYRRQNIFENLIDKYILKNEAYIRIKGKHDPDVYDDYKFQETCRLRNILINMPKQKRQRLENYQPPSVLQNSRRLPIIEPNQFQFFQEKSPTIFKIQQTEIYHIHKNDGVKISLKVDISDIEEEEMRMLAVICETYPYMGYQGLKGSAYQQYVNFYIKDIKMKYETVRSVSPPGMKIYMYLEIEFIDRNSQFGFNLFTNLVHHHDHKNINVISERMRKKGSEMYHQITDNIIQVHGRHIAGTKTPYALIQDPIFQARSICNLASQLLKISNPKSFLYSIAHQMHKVTQKINQKERVTLLIECKKEFLGKYEKYLGIFMKGYKKGETVNLEMINDRGFEPSHSMKYFPNYSEQIIFQTFNVPYYTDLQKAPGSLLLSSIINHNINNYNPLGGCFLFKGALVSYLRGSRKKYIELESYYRNVDSTSIDMAKRFIFKKFRRYTAADLFYTGIEAKEARLFKQAVAMADVTTVDQCLHQYIIKSIKQGTSSMLSLGPHIGNYQPLIKKGWSIERSVEDMSMKMQGKSSQTPQLQMSKYINLY